MAIFARSVPTFARCVHRHVPLTQTNMPTVRRVRRRARTALQPAQNMRASGTSNFGEYFAGAAPDTELLLNE